ncbi:MAG: hypothetical protein M0019_11260 [Actinomycetota bacterium]|nr:hypothetical protein [Actinomycetota bacterium]
MKLNSVKFDRTVGAAVKCAACDIVGAPYEFHPQLSKDIEVTMFRGGGWNSVEDRRPKYVDPDPTGTSPR